MDRSVAQGRPADPRTDGWSDARSIAVARGRGRRRLRRRSPCAVVLRGPGIDRFYDHFVWQAEAFLEGQAAIRYPVGRGVAGNEYFQDVLPVAAERRRRRAALIPFPPLPAIVLAAVRRALGARHGRPGRLRGPRRASTSGSAGGCSGGCRCASGSGSRRRSSSPSARSSGTPRSSARPGTWPTSSRSAWRCSRSGFALGADPRRRSTTRGRRPPASARDRRVAAVAPRPARRVDGRQFLAGLLFGLACTARLTIAVRGAVLRARRGRRQLVGGAAARPASARRIPVGRAARLQPRDDRPRLPPGLRVPVPSSRRPATRRSATTSTGPSRTRATSRRTSGSCCSACRSSLPDTCPIARRDDRGVLHGAGRRARPVRRATARSPCPATSG